MIVNVIQRENSLPKIGWDIRGWVPPALSWKYEDMAPGIFFLRTEQNIIMSRGTRFPTMWYVRPAKPQISLRIRAVWSEPLLVAWVFYDCWATDWTSFGVSKLKRRLQRLVQVYTCQNVKLLEIYCGGSYNVVAEWEVGTIELGFFSNYDRK